MDCKIVEEKIIDYMSGDLAGPSAEDIASHLQQCETCMKEATLLRKTMAALKNGYSERALFELASSKTDPLPMTLSPKRLKVLETARDEWIKTHAPAGFSMEEFTSRIETKPGIPEESVTDIYKATADDLSKENEQTQNTPEEPVQTKPITVEPPKSRSTVRQALNPDITPVYLTRQKKHELKRTTMKFKLPLQKSFFQEFRAKWFKPLALSMSCAGIAFLAVYVNDFSFVYKDATPTLQQSEVATTNVSYVKAKEAAPSAEPSDTASTESNTQSTPHETQLKSDEAQLTPDKAQLKPSDALLKPSVAALTHADSAIAGSTMAETEVAGSAVGRGGVVNSEVADLRVADVTVAGSATPLPPAPLPQKREVRPSGTIESKTLREISMTEELITDSDDGFNLPDTPMSNFAARALSKVAFNDLSNKKSKGYLSQDELPSTESQYEKLRAPTPVPLKSVVTGTLIASPFDSRQCFSISDTDEVKIVPTSDSESEPSDYGSGTSQDSFMDEDDSTVSKSSIHIPFDEATVTARQKILTYYARRLIKSGTSIPGELSGKLRTILRREADILLPLMEKEIERNDFAKLIEEACK